jgi:hypothetical protein
MAGTIQKRPPRTTLIALGIGLLFAVFWLPSALASSNSPATSATASTKAARPLPAPTSTPACGLAWRLVDSPSIEDNNNTLSAIAALSSSDVWAVGSTGSLGGRDLLIEHWDGATWRVVSAPDVGTGDNHLQGIAAIAHDDIWAVGNAGDNTLTLHWDGYSWSLKPSVDPSTYGNYLNTVAAASSNDVWAGGYYSDGILYLTMAEHWNGTAWTVVPTASVDRANNVFLGSEAIAANDAWLVGLYSLDGKLRTYIQHWDGSAWNVVESPNLGHWSAVVSASAVSSRDIWAVGAYSDNSPLQTLSEHWDGTNWNVVPSPNDGQTTKLLSAVSAISEHDIWAVGESLETSEAIVLHWDGTEWHTVPSPSRGTQNNLNAVAALSHDEVWAVGDYTNEALWMQTLTERYNEPCPPATATPTATETRIPTATPTPPTPTPTICPISYHDVSPSDYFYQAVRYLTCHGVISGYSDGTFRPYNNTTRGQLTKIVVLAQGWLLQCPAPGHFSDVPVGSPFFCYVETAAAHNIVTGYSDSTFRPGNGVTRGQLSKIIILASGWQDDCPSTGHFSDVPVGNPFFCYIETAYSHGIISGYADGTFRPYGDATRGQVSKIVYNALVRP